MDYMQHFWTSILPSKTTFLCTNFLIKGTPFGFSIVRMPHLDSNIPSNIFYGAFFSETLRVARCSLRKDDFVDRVKQLLERMIYQGGCLKILLKQIHKAYARHPLAFASFNCRVEELIFDMI